MDGAYRADLGALDDLVRRMSRFETRTAEVGADVDAEVARLHGQWSGAAADDHLAAHRAWSSSAEQMHEALGTLRELVSTAHANYGAAVAAGRAMWQ